MKRVVGVLEMTKGFRSNIYDTKLMKDEVVMIYRRDYLPRSELELFS